MQMRHGGGGATHLVEAVVTGAASSRQEPPHAAAGEHQVRGGLGGLGVGERAGQEVMHHALLDAYLLYGALEHGEQKRDEPQQHQLCSKSIGRRQARIIPSLTGVHSRVTHTSMNMSMMMMM